MKFEYLLSLAAATYVAADISQEGPKYIKADISKNTLSLPSLLQRRGAKGGIGTALFNEMSYYQIDMEVGTPPQKLSALLDTGSSDLWFFSRDSGVKNVPLFDPAQSQSFHNNYSSFRIEYVSGSAQGNWGTDNVKIGGATVKGQSFAVVNRGNGVDGLPGLVGVGVTALESTNQGYFNRREYQNLPASLHSQGLIDTPTFSLYLNNADAKQGSVLFGAVDHSKYKGQLYTVPRTSSTRYNIALDTIKVDGEGLGGATVNLDSGTTLGSLPDRLASSLAAKCGLKFNNQIGAYSVENGKYNPNLEVAFVFSGITFQVKLEDLLISSEKLGPPIPSGLKIFAFGPASATGDQVIFGDIFLRNFYVVYDLKNKQIGIALAKFENTEPQIEAITTTKFPRSVVVSSLKSRSNEISDEDKPEKTDLTLYDKVKEAIVQAVSKPPSQGFTRLLEIHMAASP